MNSVCTPFLDNLIQSYVFIYCVYVDNSQIHVCSPNFFHKFQTHISSCLLDISTWISNRHLKHICPQLNFSLVLSPFSSIFSSCRLFHFANSSSIFSLVQNVIVILDFSYPACQEIYWLYLQNISRIWTLLTNYTQVWATDSTYLDYCSQPPNWFASIVSFQ